MFTHRPAVGIYPERRYKEFQGPIHLRGGSAEYRFGRRLRTGSVIGRQEGKINIKKEGLRRDCDSDRKGRLSIVGIGPGDLSHLTQKARDAIVECQVIVGYNTYVSLLGDLVSGKEIVSSGMTLEVERARQAIEKAREGKKVAIVSSGDPGVYGMAGIALELLGPEDRQRFDIDIVPGVIAACASASLLGAPLAHDFAAVSLSDLLTDITEIKKRLIAAARSDFVIVLYNPKSKSRAKPLDEAWKIIAKYRPSDTPVGIVKNAFRDGEGVRITTVGKAPLLKDIDMTTTIIVGSSRTYVRNGYMITPRGYDI